MLSLLFNHKKYSISEHDRNISIGLRITDVCNERLGITLSCFWWQRVPLLLLLDLKSLLKFYPKNVSKLATSLQRSRRFDPFLPVFKIIWYFLIWYLGMPQSISIIGTSYQYTDWLIGPAFVTKWKNYWIHPSDDNGESDTSFLE